MNDAHKMDNTNKIVTIIGLVLEGFSAFFLLMFLLVWDQYMRLVSLAESDMSAEEFEILVDLFDVLHIVVIVTGIILSIAFVVNIVLFSKLVRGRLTEQTAKKVYLYQAIWGGVSLLFNQITGILYLVSGVRGFNNQREETDIREGI